MINMFTIGIDGSKPRAINVLCKPERFSDVFEIYSGELRPEKYITYISKVYHECNRVIKEK